MDVSKFKDGRVQKLGDERVKPPFLPYLIIYLFYTFVCIGQSEKRFPQDSQLLQDVLRISYSGAKIN